MSLQLSMPKQMGPKAKDLTGQRFSRLVVVEFLGVDSSSLRHWKCRCDCGKEVVVIGSNLTRGNSRSCGCLLVNINQSRSTHNMSRTPEYRAWSKIKDRCYREDNDNYQYYGGRGIKMCDRWLESFEAFHEDMGPMPAPGYQVDRKDSNGDYSPENCRWATKKTQARNTRSNRLEEFGGVVACVAEWAEILGVPGYIFANRARSGNSVQDTIRHILQRKRESLGYVVHAVTETGATGPQ